MTKDEYVSTIEQAGFQNVRIVEEKHHPFEDVAEDTYAKVVANLRKNTQRVMCVSELDEETKEMMKKIRNSMASISVYAMKPRVDAGDLNI